jgi:hypothetical protein
VTLHIKIKNKNPSAGIKLLGTASIKFDGAGRKAYPLKSKVRPVLRADSCTMLIISPTQHELHDTGAVEVSLHWNEHGQQAQTKADERAKAEEQALHLMDSAEAEAWGKQRFETGPGVLLVEVLKVSEP